MRGVEDAGAVRLERRRGHARARPSRGDRAAAVRAAASRKYWMPGTPSTFASSCGSHTAVVVPRGSTARWKLSGTSSELSRWTCASMKPGTTCAPCASISRAPRRPGASADDEAVLDRDVAVDERAGEHVEAAHVAEDEVARLEPSCCAKTTAESVCGTHISKRTAQAAPPTRYTRARAGRTSCFDDAAIARLKLAAEEVAWLTGRGYALDVVGELVARHHDLSSAHRAALAAGRAPSRSTGVERRASSSRRTSRKRPLAVDAIDVVAAIEAALAGRHVLQTLDGTVRAFGIDRARYAPSNEAEAANRAPARSSEGATAVAREDLHRRGLGRRDRSLVALHRARKGAEGEDRARARPRRTEGAPQGTTDRHGRCRDARRVRGLAQPGRPIVEAVPGAKIVRLQ